MSDDWQEQVTRRVKHAAFVAADALAICDEHPMATLAYRHRLACAVQDLADTGALVPMDDRGLEFAEDVLERVRQVDEPRVIRATDHRLARATTALDRVRKAIRGERP